MPAGLGVRVERSGGKMKRILTRMPPARQLAVKMSFIVKNYIHSLAIYTSRRLESRFGLAVGW